MLDLASLLLSELSAVKPTMPVQAAQGLLAVAKHDGGRRPIRLPDSRRSICER
jgi:hypothetical protein